MGSVGGGSIFILCGVDNKLRKNAHTFDRVADQKFEMQLNKKAPFPLPEILNLRMQRVPGTSRNGVPLVFLSLIGSGRTLYAKSVVK